MIFETKRLILKTIESKDLLVLRNYLIKNRKFLSNWEPMHEDNYYEDYSILKMIESEIEGNDKQSLLSLYIYLKNDTSIIGKVALSNIVRGGFQSCFIGYKIDENEINKGYITEAITEVIRVAFEEYKLHRIEANIMPKNVRSIRVVEKLGFEYEGISKKYLNIDGIWEDHCHYVILNDDIE